MKTAESIKTSKNETECVKCSEEEMELIRHKILSLIQIVSDLENQFPGRHFTLDGHLVGSIGEVISVYYYGINLYKSSAEVHDGIVDGKEVQIKVTQKNNIMISSKPEYLIVLYMTKDGHFYEVYNGPGKEPWDSVKNVDKHNNKHLSVNMLMKLDQTVADKERIKSIHQIAKMKKEFKNRKNLNEGSM